jgi:Reverse transcriptase (RNA-dependent DNA polymerase)
LKIRIAIRGDLDQGALEEDNSAPLASFRLLKVFVADAARQRKRIYQSDFIAAYLQSRMDRIVYVRLPIEFIEFFPDLAEWFGVPLLLEKSAYGINSAGRLWAEELFGWYAEYGFVQSKVDPSLFRYQKGDEWIVLLSYCDDTAYYASSTATRMEFEAAMCRRFQCVISVAIIYVD